MTAFSDWLHRLPPDQIKVLRAFRRAAKQAHYGETVPMAVTFEADKLPELLAEFDQERMPFSANEAAAIVKAMPREFVLMLDH